MYGREGSADARGASNDAIFRDARSKPRAGWCSEGRSEERESARERERERSTQPPMYRCGIIDISNCFDGEEVHRPARPGPAGRDVAGWNGVGWDATCPGSRIFEGARVDPVPPL